jgi:peroxiredoxin
VKKATNLGGRTVFCLVVMLVGLCLLSDRGWADRDLMEKLGIVAFKEEIEAPNFSLKDLNGNNVNLTDHRGRVVFLNFWATWCPPCLAEIPSMEKLHTEFEDRDFTILAVDLKENPDRVRSFRDKKGVSFSILLDTDGKVGLRYGVRSIPTTYLIDKTGHIIGGALGPRDWGSTEAFQLIDHLINSSSPS